MHQATCCETGEGQIDFILLKSNVGVLQCGTKLHSLADELKISHYMRPKSLINALIVTSHKPASLPLIKDTNPAQSDNTAVKRCPLCCFMQSGGTLILEVYHWPDHQVKTEMKQNRIEKA